MQVQQLPCFCLVTALYDVDVLKKVEPALLKAISVGFYLAYAIYITYI